MTTAINPSLIPTIPPGDLFKALTTQQTLNIRWLCALDPVYYEVFNRPLADIAVRQLTLAKALDQVNSNLGHGAVFPFLVQPRIAAGSGDVDVPPGLIWDVSAALPKKWENFRLAKIKRIAGVNPPTDTEGPGGTAPPGPYTGKLRLIFTASQINSTVETAIFQADYDVGNQRTYQPQRLTVVAQPEEQLVLNPNEIDTVAGFIVFKTLSLSDPIVENFLNVTAPPTGAGAAPGTHGNYLNPAVYEIIDSAPGDVSGDFTNVILKHGTGLFGDSVWTAIPPVDSDVQSWINAFNYPFDADANRTSTNGVTIPLGMFREFNVCVPAGDQPTGDVSGLFYKVWITRIERVDVASHQIRLFFATYNVTDIGNGSPSLAPIEFATLDLLDNMQPGEAVEIVPIGNLLLQNGADASLFGQHFGRGHVVLSSAWSATSSMIVPFFESFDLIADNPADIIFTDASTRISSFGLSRTPKYSPTIGQAQALRGTTARLIPPLNPADGNRFVTEQDQGLGMQIDLEAQAGINPHPAIQRFGRTGALCHKLVMLVVDGTKTPSGDNNFYNSVVLPRLRVLLGRDPIFGDEWFNGTRKFFHNGDTWQSAG